MINQASSIPNNEEQLEITRVENSTSQLETQGSPTVNKANKPSRDPWYTRVFSKPTDFNLSVQRYKKKRALEIETQFKEFEKLEIEGKVKKLAFPEEITSTELWIEYELLIEKLEKNKINATNNRAKRIAVVFNDDKDGDKERIPHYYRRVNKDIVSSSDVIKLALCIQWPDSPYKSKYSEETINELRECLVLLIKTVEPDIFEKRTIEKNKQNINRGIEMDEEAKKITTIHQKTPETTGKKSSLKKHKAEITLTEEEEKEISIIDNERSEGIKATIKIDKTSKKEKTAMKKRERKITFIPKEIEDGCKRQENEAPEQRSTL